jgi:hypothetical protein
MGLKVFAMILYDDDLMWQEANDIQIINHNVSCRCSQHGRKSWRVTYYNWINYTPTVIIAAVTGLSLGAFFTFSDLQNCPWLIFRLTRWTFRLREC